MDEPKIFDGLIVFIPDDFLSPKGIVAEKLSEFGISVSAAHAIHEELTEYMKHNKVVMAVNNNELCFGRLKEE